MPREDLFSFGYRNPRYFERVAPSSTLHDGPRFGGVADPSFLSGHALPSSCHGACHRVTSVRPLKRRSFRKLPRPRSGTEPMFKWKQSSRFLAIELVSMLYFALSPLRGTHCEQQADFLQHRLRRPKRHGRASCSSRLINVFRSAFTRTRSCR